MQVVKFYERCHDDPIFLRGYVFLLLVLSMCVAFCRSTCAYNDSHRRLLRLQTMIMSYKAWVATIEVVQWVRLLGR